MKILWNTVIGTTVVAVLGFGSVGVMAVASSLTIDEEAGRVQPLAPVSVDATRSTAPGDNPSVDAGPPPAVDVPSTDTPSTDARSIDVPTPAPSLVPTDPTSPVAVPPVAVPPAASRTISDTTIAGNTGTGITDDSGGGRGGGQTVTADTSGTSGSSKPRTVDASGSKGADDN